MNKLITHLKGGNFEHLFRVLMKRLYSESKAYGLKRDLSVSFSHPDARIPIRIRKLEASDLKAFSANHTNYGLFEKNIKTAYVACDENNTPCYYQWLIDATFNPEINRFWKGSFPELASNEALLENAFTIPEFRGLRIMPAAMSRIACKAEGIPARYVITFVEINNIPSLKGCIRAGFEPYTLRSEKWICFFKTVRFKPLGEGPHMIFKEIPAL